MTSFYLLIFTSNITLSLYLISISHACLSFSLFILFLKKVDLFFFFFFEELSDQLTARTVWGKVLRTFQNHVYDDVCVLYVVKVVKGLRPHFVKALEINSENIMASLYVTLFTYLVVVFFLQVPLLYSLNLRKYIKSLLTNLSNDCCY